MKEVKSRRGSKQIIIIIVMMMLCNFIVPNYSYAVSTESGGSVLEVIAQFVCAIPDEVINYLQNMFASPSNIKMSGENYKIKYSPAIIFAGKVPAFDINFINPMEDKVVNETNNYISMNTSTEDVSIIINRLKENRIDSDLCTWGGGGNPQGIVDRVCSDYYYNVREYSVGVFGINSEDWLDLNTLLEIEKFIMGGFQYDSAWIYENTLYFSVFHEVNYLAVHHITYAVYSTTLTDSELEILEEMAIKSESTKTYKSIASVLQGIVATWYNALRRIALVGLLSVLVYIGIRIVLTSTSAKDKAKYKNMLKDWLVALCLLFALHYVMNLTIIVVGKINEIIGASVIGAEGEDILMSTVRNYIALGENWGSVLAYVVIYCVLAVYTVIFTIQYLKRVIYIAFLTMIAPLITLTYPLDKIKDKKAQAFDMWLKDYIFFSLIQVLHLLIYYIFLGSALDLANQGNWIFAIVAIGFMTKAEKIMKKMFGFEKSKTLGAMAAGATGALVMNAINKISHKPAKGGSSGGHASSGEGGSNSNVRTATTNPLATLSTGGAMTVNNSGGNTSPSPQGSGSSDGMSNLGGNSSQSTRYRNGRNKYFSKCQ